MNISISFFGNSNSNWRDNYLFELKKHFSLIYSSNNSSLDINHLLNDDIIVLDLNNSSSIDINTYSTIIQNLKLFRFAIIILPQNSTINKEEKENIFYINNYDLLYEIIICLNRMIRSHKHIKHLTWSV